MKSSTKASLFFILIFSHLQSFTQTSVGLKVGTQLTTWNIDGEVNFGFDNPKIKVRLQIGRVIEIALSDFISIQPEFLYIQKGTKVDLEDGYYGYSYYYSNDFEGEGRYKFDYLELPLLVKLKFDDMNDTNFFLTAGPSFGYLTKATIEFEITVDGETDTDSEEFEFDDDDGIDRFDISAAFGAGVGFPLGIGKLTFETRYLIGLSNLIAENDFNDGSIKNRGLAVSLGYMYPLSRKNKEVKKNKKGTQ